MSFSWIQETHRQEICPGMVWNQPLPRRLKHVFFSPKKRWYISHPFCKPQSSFSFPPRKMKSFVPQTVDQNAAGAGDVCEGPGEFEVGSVRQGESGARAHSKDDRPDHETQRKRGPDTLFIPGPLEGKLQRRFTIEIHPEFREATHSRNFPHLTRKLISAKLKIASR